MARRDDPMPPTPEDPRTVLPRRSPGSHRTIETVLLASTACLLAAVAWPIATGQVGGPPPTAVEPAVEPAVSPAPTPIAAPTIQLALLLDTSGSMNGLIDQARSRLWNVVNALDAATFQGATPRLEVAIYEYGNDRIPGEAGYIRQVVGFTGELDEVSRALFSLSTNGGSEHAPQAIARASDELAWKDGAGVLRVLYVAGNETFQQGPTTWTDAVDDAAARGIVVNTVFCGRDGDLDAPLWRAAAARGHGRHFMIDHDAVVADPPTPFDEQIASLGVAINGTYVGYGARGGEGMENQRAQDDNSYAAGSAVIRGLSKSGANYHNPSWDLVDAVADGVVDVSSMPADALPETLRGLDAQGRAAYIGMRRAERAAIVAKLAELRTERDAFLAEVRADAKAPASLDVAMIEALGEHARGAGFTLAR